MVYMNNYKKSFLFSVLLMTMNFSISNEQTNGRDDVIDEAFVTFATPNYFGLLEVLLDSVHYFSKRPIVVYGINTDLPFNTNKYPRLIKRRIDVDGEYSQLPLIYFQKLNIILKSNINYGIYIEADDIVNYGIDSLFARCKDVDSYPLYPIHPRDPNNQSSIMHLLGVTKKSMPYVHGHIIFSQKCMPFLRECYDFCCKYKGSIGANWDETVMNVMLWKHKVTDHYVPIFDPYFTSITNYISGDDKFKDPYFQPIANYISEYKKFNIDMKNIPIEYHMFHGCKNTNEARHVFELLKNNIGRTLYISGVMPK